MSLAIGQCLGPYEIVATIGAGGLGEADRARRAGQDYSPLVAQRRVKDERTTKLTPKVLFALPFAVTED